MIFEIKKNMKYNKFAFIESLKPKILDISSPIF